MKIIDVGILLTVIQEFTMSEEQEEVKKEKLVSINSESYVETKTSSGVKSLCNGDTVALALSTMSMEQVYTVADEVIVNNDFRAKYNSLNKGMQRMNVGNRIRGFIAKNIKDNEKITKFNGDLKEGVGPKPLEEDVSLVFTRAIESIPLPMTVSA